MPDEDRLPKSQPWRGVALAVLIVLFVGTLFSPLWMSNLLMPGKWF